MAIEFAGCLIYSRSRGHNAVQAAAYRSASRLYDERTGQWFDYGHKPDVIHSEVLLPEGADQSFSDRSTLWNHIEQIENRRDSQLAKDYILALPKELSLEENKELARRFAEYHFVSKGLVADLNIHDDEGNPHAHIFVTTRRLLGMSFSKKARDLNPEFFAGKVVEKDYWNTKWREFQNSYFEEEGIDLFVDPNHLVPTVHRGRKRNDDRADYIDAKNEYNQELSREIALTNPEAVMNQLSQKYMVFSDREIACVLNKATQTAEEFQTAMLKLKAHPNLVTLGPGDDGRERYATRQSIETESRLQDNAEKLQKSAHHIVSPWRVQDQITKYDLNEGQANALNHVMLDGDIGIVVGKAGTGKSYLMKAANDVWQQEGYRVLGISVAGIASESLEFESNIQSSTIASFKYRLEKKKLLLGDKDVIVLDEAGMVDAYELNGIVKVVREAGAKLILVGDHNQVQPIGPGAPFRALLEKIGFVELTEIKRQNLAEDRQATTLLSTGKTAEALEIYGKKGQIHLADKVDEAKSALITKWGQHLAGNAALTESIILAHRNEDVKALNLQARDYLVKTGFLSAKGVEVETINGKITLAAGDRILFTENSWKLKVKNGHFATVKSIKGSKITAIIIKGKTKREVIFDTDEYKHFSYGYAATIYKTQGVTVNNAFVYAGGEYWSRNLIYVALSRHREMVHLFADRETHKDFETLKKNLSRFSIKDAVIDFPLQYALRRGFDPDKLLGKCMEALHQAKETIKDKWLFLANIEAYQDRVEKTLKEQAVQQRRADAVLVAKFTDIYREVGRQWSDMKRELKPGEELANHAKFSENYDFIIERNRLAYQIYQHPEKYELAMELNGIDLATLKPYVTAHLARERVLEYERLATGKKGKGEKGSLAAGKQAAEIMRDGKTHGQFVRERGLDWKMINHLGFVYTQKYLLYSQDREQRKLHQDVIDYVGQARFRVQVCKKLYYPREELNLFATSSRNTEQKRERAHFAVARLDAMAYNIYSHKKDRYEQALANLNIKVDKLEFEAERHLHREEVLAFLKAERDGHDLLKQKIAWKIKQNLAAHHKSYSAVIRELEFKGMDWNKLHLNAWAYAERRKSLYMGTEERRVLEVYQEYRSFNRDLSKAIGRNKVPVDQYKEQDHRRRQKYMTIKALVAKRDRSATEVWDELIHIDVKAKAFEKLDIARLEKENAAHFRREEIKAFMENWQASRLSSQVTARKLANDPEYAKLIKEQQAQYRIDKNLKAFDLREKLASLPPEERKLYREVEHYRTLVYQSSKAWKRTQKETQSDQAIKALAKNTQIAKGFTDQASELAYKISQHFEQYQPYLAALGVDEARLQKVARHFGATKAYNNRVQHYRSLLTSENIDVKKETYNVDRISEALINMGEGFYQKVLGDLYSKPKRHGHNIRVGNKGAFSFNVSGSHVGAWHSFESGEGGYPLQLLMNANYGYGLNFEDALKEGARIAGLSDSQAKDVTYIRKQKSAAEIEAEAHLLAQEKQKKIETARYYVKTSQPIAGTVAERYLRETRGIEGDLSGFRFHPRVKDPETERYYPAALITAKNEKGQITACQTILIDTTTLKKVAVEVPKRTRGVISGSAALLQQGSSNTVVIAEGPETGASLMKAMPDANIYVTVGNIRNAEHLDWLAKKHNTDTLYFAADNDGDNLKPAESLKKAAQTLEAQGIKAYKAVPKLGNVEKPDFNDVLIHQGVDGIKAQMNTMSRILNESEKINLDLVEVAAFTIKEDRVELSPMLLKQVDWFFKLEEDMNQRVTAMTNLIINGDQNNPEFEKLQAAIDVNKTEKLELSKTLLREETLWQKVRRMTEETVIMEDVSIQQYKAQARDNRFEVNALQKLEEDMRVVVHQEEKSLTQSRGRHY